MESVKEIKKQFGQYNLSSDLAVIRFPFLSSCAQSYSVHNNHENNT